MNKLTVTNQKLLSVNAEFDAIAATGLGLLLVDKVNDFYKKNGEKIKNVQKAIIDIQQKHLVFEDGKIKFPELKDGQASKTPLFLLGHTEEQLQAEYKSLMEGVIELEL